MGGIDQRLEIGVGAEMRIDPREIGDPIAVIARGFVPRRALNGLVLEDRADPQRRDAEILEIAEPIGQPLEVAAVIEALVGRIVTGVQPIARQPAAIVRGIAILEAIGQQEIDHFVLRQAGAKPVRWRGSGRRRQRGDQGCPDQHRRSEHAMPPRERARLLIALGARRARCEFHHPGIQATGIRIQAFLRHAFPRRAFALVISP